jgi:hypothetical protein
VRCQGHREHPAPRRGGLEERGPVAALTHLRGRARPRLLDEALRSVLASPERTRDSSRLCTTGATRCSELQPRVRLPLTVPPGLTTVVLGLDPSNASSALVSSATVGGYLSAAVAECDSEVISVLRRRHRVGGNPEPGWPRGGMTNLRGGGRREPARCKRVYRLAVLSATIPLARPCASSGWRAVGALSVSEASSDVVPEADDLTAAAARARRHRVRPKPRHPTVADSPACLAHELGNRPDAKGGSPASFESIVHIGTLDTEGTRNRRGPKSPTVGGRSPE